MAAFSLDDSAILELTGIDRLEWLQGQATNDVRGLVPEAHLAFCFCEPTGQILALLDAWAEEERILLVTARERVPAVLDRVERMTILEDVAAHELPLVGVWIEGRPAEGLLALPSRYGAGWDVWTDPETAKTLLTGKTADETQLRLLAGVPKWGADMGPRTLPPELGPDFEAKHVSYAKGCYTGQEVLMRMHSRGHTNKTWVGLLSNEPLAVGQSATFEGKEVGLVTSASTSALDDGRYVAAATLRNEATTAGTMATVGEAAAEVRPMPVLSR